MTDGTAPKPRPSGGSWPAVARVVARWLDRRERVDELLPVLSEQLTGAERARGQNLLYGVVRHYGRLESELADLIAHPPRFLTRAILYLAGFELIEAAGAVPADPGRAARIVHHAVEQAKVLSSAAESRLANAVLRRLADRVAQAQVPGPVSGTAQLARWYSHPEWLVRRWREAFGPQATRQLLEWNQQPAPVHARWRSAEPPPDWLRPTAWEGFFEVLPGHWPQVMAAWESGRLYLQDPATRLAVALLDPQPGEAVLDACASPGGKSLQIADLLKSRTAASGGLEGRLIAIDLPGARIDRLRENLARVSGVPVALVQGDLCRGIRELLQEHGLPQEYPAVLLDVPCSNSGVMRHRVDVKWRLQPADFRKHARQQGELLHAAARLVAPGGRLVYSTCSIDPEENEQVVQRFLEGRAGERFSLEAREISLPWLAHHDGAGAFRLRARNGEQG